MTFDCDPPCQIRIDAEGFKGKNIEISANTTVQLEPAGAAEMVTVTAYREPLGELESPVTTRTLPRRNLQTAARHLHGRASCASCPGWSCSGAPVPWSPILPRRA